MMDVQHENLPNGFAVTFIDEATKQRIRYVADLQNKEIVKGLESQGWMHWLPMTEDAVFDRSESMLFRLAKYDTTDASGIYYGSYWDMIETYRPFITHYARITEPNK